MVSCSSRFNPHADWRMLATRLWCVSITPLGRPVVPLEYGSATTCVRGSIATGGGAPPRASSDAKGVAPLRHRLPRRTRIPRARRRRGRLAGLFETGRDRHERARASVLELLAELGRRVGRVDRGDDPAEQRDGVKRDRVLGQVRAVDREDVPLAEAARRQSGRRPWTASTNPRYVSVRPLGPSMNAGLSPRAAACSRRNGVSATSGMTTIRLGRAENHRDILSGRRTFRGPKSSLLTSNWNRTRPL